MKSVHRWGVQNISLCTLGPSWGRGATRVTTEAWADCYIRHEAFIYLCLLALLRMGISRCPRQGPIATVGRPS